MVAQANVLPVIGIRDVSTINASLIAPEGPTVPAHVSVPRISLNQTKMRIPTQNVGVTALASTVGIPSLAPTLGVPAAVPTAALPATILNVGVTGPKSSDEAAAMAPVKAPEQVAPMPPPMSCLYVDLCDDNKKSRDNFYEIDNSWTVVNNGKRLFQVYSSIVHSEFFIFIDSIMF